MESRLVGTAVLVWCLQAIRAANPRINLEGTSGRTRGPAEGLRFRLEAAIEASPAGLPPLEELATEQTLPMVETWRQAARAAALGEHDFDAGLGYGRLSDAQCMTVLKDAAEVTRALVGLDRRYSNIPGWQSFKDLVGWAGRQKCARCSLGSTNPTTQSRSSSAPGLPKGRSTTTSAARPGSSAPSSHRGSAKSRTLLSPPPNPRTTPGRSWRPGCRAFLTACSEPAVQQIMLIDGPAALGWSEWRAMNEAALWLAHSTDPGDLPDTIAALSQLLESLRPQGRTAPTGRPGSRSGPGR